MMRQVSSDPRPVLDGRLARSVRTRKAVIDALVALYEEGDLSPTAVRVAGRAGVALRTVYGHFADMESLFAEAGDRELDRLVEVRREVRVDQPYDQRLAAFVANRGVVLEWLLPIMRSAAMREATSPQLLRNRERFVALGDAETRWVFAAELAALPAARRAEVVHAVHLVAGGPAWIALRLDRGLEPDAATALLLRVLAATLDELLLR